MAFKLRLLKNKKMPGVQRGEKEIPRRENNLCIVLEHGKNVDCSDYRKNTGRAGKK